jgi:hypothetical protein
MSHQRRAPNRPYHDQEAFQAPGKNFSFNFSDVENPARVFLTLKKSA